MHPRVKAKFSVSYFEVSKIVLKQRKLQYKLVGSVVLFLVTILLPNPVLQFACSSIASLLLLDIHANVYNKKREYENKALSTFLADERSDIGSIAGELRKSLHGPSKESAQKLLSKLADEMAHSIAKGVPVKEAVFPANVTLRHHFFAWKIDAKSHPWEVLHIECMYSNEWPLLTAYGKIVTSA